MKTIRKLNVFQFALFQAFLLFLIGVLCGILYSFGGLIIDSMVSLGWLSPEKMETPGLSYGTVLAFGALIGMPLIGAGIGFATGIIEAILYNIYAYFFRGIKLDFELK